MAVYFSNKGVLPLQPDPLDKEHDNNITKGRNDFG